MVFKAMGKNVSRKEKKNGSVLTSGSSNISIRANEEKEPPLR